MYIGVKRPTVLAFADQMPSLQTLLQAVRPLLPRRFHAHLSPGLTPLLTEHFQLTALGAFYKMGLAAIQAFYAQCCYLDNFFRERMLATGHYYVVWRDGAPLPGVAQQKRGAHWTQCKGG